MTCSNCCIMLSNMFVLWIPSRVSDWPRSQHQAMSWQSDTPSSCCVTWIDHSKTRQLWNTEQKRGWERSYRSLVFLLFTSSNCFIYVAVNFCAHIAKTWTPRSCQQTIVLNMLSLSTKGKSIFKLFTVGVLYMWLNTA